MGRKRKENYTNGTLGRDEEHLALGRAERSELCTTLIEDGSLQKRTRRTLELFLEQSETFLAHDLFRDKLQTIGTLSKVDSIIQNVNVNLRRTGLDSWVEVRRTPPFALHGPIPNERKRYFLILVHRV